MKLSSKCKKVIITSSILVGLSVPTSVGLIYSCQHQTTNYLEPKANIQILADVNNPGAQPNDPSVPPVTNKTTIDITNLDANVKDSPFYKIFNGNRGFAIDWSQQSAFEQASTQLKDYINNNKLFVNASTNPAEVSAVTNVVMQFKTGGSITPPSPDVPSLPDNPQQPPVVDNQPTTPGQRALEDTNVVATITYSGLDESKAFVNNLTQEVEIKLKPIPTGLQSSNGFNIFNAIKTEVQSKIGPQVNAPTLEQINDIISKFLALPSTSVMIPQVYTPWTPLTLTQEQIKIDETQKSVEFLANAISIRAQNDPNRPPITTTEPIIVNWDVPEPTPPNDSEASTWADIGVILAIVFPTLVLIALIIALIVFIGKSYKSTRWYAKDNENVL